MMFFSPKNNKLTGYDDINRLKRYYPKNITVKLRKSARLPFMEEPDEVRGGAARVRRQIPAVALAQRLTPLELGQVTAAAETTRAQGVHGTGPCCWPNA